MSHNDLNGYRVKIHHIQGDQIQYIKKISNSFLIFPLVLSLSADLILQGYPIMKSCIVIICFAIIE